MSIIEDRSTQRAIPFPDHVLEPEEEKKSDLQPYDEYWIKMYTKVGLYSNWSWDQYENTPILVVDYINEDLDKKLSHYCKESSSGEPGKPPVAFNHLYLLLALAELFGGSDDEDAMG